MQSIKYEECKAYIGCVSRNTVEAVLELSNEKNILIGLIPSRRQVDHDGGYINFTTKELKKYINGHSDNVILQRDHGGPMQGKNVDDGIDSMIADSSYCDLIHIDPWKQCGDLDDGIALSKRLMDICLFSGFSGYFEIATEESIRHFSLSDLQKVIYECRRYPIKYIVVQSGTALENNSNTGSYNKKRLTEYSKLVELNSFLSKEHNGDYLKNSLIKEKFKCGLNAINIAPEFGFYESECYIDAIKSNDIKLLDTFYDICYESNQWRKWISKDFDISDKEKLIAICGHYVLENNSFHDKIKRNLPDISSVIKNKIKNKILSIYEK